MAIFYEIRVAPSANKYEGYALAMRLIENIQPRVDYIESLEREIVEEKARLDDLRLSLKEWTNVKIAWNPFLHLRRYAHHRRFQKKICTQIQYQIIDIEKNIAQAERVCSYNKAVLETYMETFNSNLQIWLFYSQ